MASGRRFRRRNPLLRRVRRHANTTTLFRMRGADAPQQPVAAQSAPPVATNQPLAPPAAPAAPSLDEVIARAEAAPSPRTPPPRSAAPPAQATAPPQTDAPPPAQRQASAPPEEEGSLPWRRLERIAQLHRERRQGAAASPPASETAQRAPDSSATSQQPPQETPQPPPAQPGAQPQAGPPASPTGSGGKQQQVPLDQAWPVQRTPDE
ncbi:MAG: hypothetical protein ACOC9V_06200, partial [Chloroflexota bacterium]